MKTLTSFAFLAILLTCSSACSVVPGESGGHCVGAATACSSRRVTGGDDSCAFQLGCSSKNVASPGEWAVWRCSGTARACETFDDADACGKQSGCSWED